MLLLVSKKMSRLIIRYGADKDNFDIYVYGFQILISSIFTFMLCVIISLLLGNLLELLCYLGVFVFVRKYVGGYHAKYYWICCLLTITTSQVSIFFARYFVENKSVILVLMYVLSSVVIFLKAPIVSKEKPQSIGMLHKRNVISKLICVLGAFIVALLWFSYRYYACLVMMTFIVIAAAGCASIIETKKAQRKLQRVTCDVSREYKT